MTTAYEMFLPEVLPYVHDCPDFVAINAIRNAVIELCEESMVLKYQLDPITAVANQPSYDLDIPDGYKVTRLLHGWYEQVPLTPKSPDQLASIFPLDWRQMHGVPKYMTQITYDEVIICPYPDVTVQDAIGLTVALTPLRNSTSVDDMIYERYAEIVGHGARARLYDTPNQPYYNPSAAIEYRRKFEAGYALVKSNEMRGLGRANIRVRPPKLV